MIEDSTVFETMVKIATIHYVQYSTDHKYLDFKRKKIIIEAFEPWYLDDLIQKMKFEIK